MPGTVPGVGDTKLKRYIFCSQGTHGLSGKTDTQTNNVRMVCPVPLSPHYAGLEKASCWQESMKERASRSSLGSQGKPHLFNFDRMCREYGGKNATAQTESRS